MTPSSAPVSMALNSSPAQWWEVLGALGPLAILLGAIVAAVIGAFTLRQRSRADGLALAQKRESDAKALEQKRRSDDRSEWWRRAQWALDRALDDRPSTKTLGLATLEVLAHSTLAHTEELELFDVAWASVNDTESRQTMLLESTEGGPSIGTDESLSMGNPAPRHAHKVQGKEVNPQERRVQVAAARLRVTLDGRLGRETPDEVKALAKKPS